jgi:hypothetical protein
MGQNHHPQAGKEAKASYFPLPGSAFVPFLSRGTKVGHEREGTTDSTFVEGGCTSAREARHYTPMLGNPFPPLG